ncbi:MAG: (d)CMP kinase [Clostridia bacterium]|nr:(d)CMP kinase [Clostridia bacterium]
MSYYIIIRGPAGVGKTTIAKNLQDKLGADYISFDEILEKYKL